jgi:hypothetical protein
VIVRRRSRPSIEAVARLHGAKAEREQGPAARTERPRREQPGRLADRETLCGAGGAAAPAALGL